MIAGIRSASGIVASFSVVAKRPRLRVGTSSASACEDRAGYARMWLQKRSRRPAAYPVGQAWPTLRVEGVQYLRSLLRRLGILLVLAASQPSAIFTQAAAQEKAPPPSREAAQYSFAGIVKKAAPAVVNVYVQQLQGPSSYADDFRRFFVERFGMPQTSLGSGVIVSPDGVVVTNAHVLKVAGTAQIRLVLADRREFTAKVLLQDEKSDIAVLRIEGGEGRFPHLEFGDSDVIEVGDMVLAIGNPFGVGQTVTSGIISAIGRTRVTRSDAQAFIQTDAAINPGNSGGALVDMAGRVVGINTAIFSASGGSHGIGFAIPSNLVKLVVDSAVTGRKLERPWLGARLDSVTRELAEEFKLARVAGAVVVRLYEKGPAAEAGLQAGDVIVAVDGYDVDDARGVHYRLTTRGIGNRAQLQIVRRGRAAKVELALRVAPSAALDARELSGAHPFDGARVANILPATAEELGLEEEEGVVLLSVRSRSTAARLGFRAGDVVMQVGRERITSVTQLESALRQRQRGWLVVVKRGNRVLQLQYSG
jgi:Do/DeqQ family serine protease